MSEPACTCPTLDAARQCPRFPAERMGPGTWGMCSGSRCTASRSQRFRDKMVARRDGTRRALPLATVAAPKRKRVELRPVCVHQGEVIPGCKTCGGEGSVIRWCESPDDDADRCVRGRSRDASVRSCLTCLHYSNSNDATTGTPPASI